MRLEDYDTSQQYRASVKQTSTITADDSKEEIKELVLELDDNAFNYKVGQSIGVLVPGRQEIGNKNLFRLYTIAKPPEKRKQEKPVIDICVKRCHYIDEYSGEEYDGVASNYLCDLKVGDQLTITGPYGLPFEVPNDKNANLIMIGMGTGIAPFRAFIKHIYRDVGSWSGKVYLFYGARTGLDMVYMNDKRDDFTNYYDEETFQAFKAISPRPQWNDPVALDKSLEERQQEVWEMICEQNTHIYVAGHESILSLLNKAFAKIAGSEENWQQKKQQLVADKRWSEIVY
jgi:ferredoxin--NADP+ reductase